MKILSSFNYKAGKDFSFTVDGAQWSLPRFDDVHEKLAEVLEEYDEDGQRLFMFAYSCNPELIETLRKLPKKVMVQVLDDWQSENGIRFPQILSLYKTIEKHTAAIEADLFQQFNIKGYKEFFDLPYITQWNTVNELQRTVQSNFSRVLNGWEWNWSLDNQIAADTLDMQIQTLQRPKNSQKPKPYGLRPNKEKTQNTTKTFGAVDLSNKTEAELQARHDRILARGPVSQKDTISVPFSSTT